MIFQKICKNIKLEEQNNKKLLSNQKKYATIILLTFHGDVAQLARAIGSYPIGRGFDPLRRYQEEFCSNFSSLINN